ncbi:MAG TPA: N-acetyl-D-Glu racemase DgcA [Azospirillaceae bacterium]|nr:N-acetyl-D-Glu racemase DgcA [Azospirillaceae bacterium]
MPILTVRGEDFPLKGTFRISRGARTTAEVVYVEIRDGDVVGRGECTPYKRYGETRDGVIADIQAMAGALGEGMTRQELQTAMKAGAARNAVDCALWDLEAKRAGKRVWELAGLPAPKPVTTVFTISLDDTDKMGAQARENAHRPLLKLKLTGDGDLERVQAVRRNAPDSRIVVDANEGWSVEHLERYAQAFADLGVEMIEQPLHADRDEAVGTFRSPLPIGADESCHTSADVPRLKRLYQVANIKLDKTGGLTEALKLKAAAEAAGMRIMVGCMVATSLSMAPALLVAQGVDFVDVDGPLWMARDREPGLRYEGSLVHPPEAALWG